MPTSRRVEMDEEKKKNLESNGCKFCDNESETQLRKAIGKKPQQKRAKLSDLLVKMTPENQHDPIDFGPPVGKEII